MLVLCASISYKGSITCYIKNKMRTCHTGKTEFFQSITYIRVFFSVDKRFNLSFDLIQ